MLGASGGPRSFGAILAVTRKELVESFRDRQTAIYTFVLPICMYPIVFWVLVQGALLLQGHREQTAVTVGLAAADPARVPVELENALIGRRPDADDDAPVRRGLTLETLGGAIDEEAARAWLADRDRESVADEPPKLDAVLYLPTPAEGDPDANARLFHDSTKGDSNIARRRIARRLPSFAADLRNDRARERGHDPDQLVPISRESHDIAPQRDQGAFILSLILPMLLVFMAVMGAFFPAVDLTAGEKERNTAETTMLLPIPRSAIHHGKILAVCTTAVIATFLNLIAIGLSAEHLLGTLKDMSDVPIELPVLALVSMAPLALLFSFFISAVLTGVAGLASTFKEGQALLGPVQMVFILPAFAGAIPGLELTPALACVPVLNVVLAFRALLLGKVLLLEYALTAGSLLLYAWISIEVAVRLLSRESVAFSRSTIPFRRLFSTLRSSGGTK